jgi:hypothetical protein
VGIVTLAFPLTIRLSYYRIAEDLNTLYRNFQKYSIDGVVRYAVVLIRCFSTVIYSEFCASNFRIDMERVFLKVC